VWGLFQWALRGTDSYVRLGEQIFKSVPAFNGGQTEGRLNQICRKDIDRQGWVGYFCSVSGAIGPTGNPVRIGNEPVAVIGDKRRNNVTGRIERGCEKNS